MGMSREIWLRVMQLPVMHKYIVDNSGVHTGSVAGPKIKVNQAKIARGKKPMGVLYFGKMTQHERVVAGRNEKKQGFKK
jgi:hypothetical protein